MNRAQKIGLTMGVCAMVSNSIAGIYLLKHYEEKDREYAEANRKFDAVKAAAVYLVAKMERDGINFTEFDQIALKIFLDEAQERREHYGDES